MTGASGHTTLIAVAAVSSVVFLAVAGFLVTTVSSEQTRQDELQEQIVRLREIVERPIRKVEEVNREFKEIQGSIPTGELSEIDIFRALENLASQPDLDFSDVSLELDSLLPRRTVGGAQYRVLSFTMKVAGDFDSVWSFVQAMDNGETAFKTLVVDELTLNLGAESRATVSFTIYTLPST